MLIRIDNDKCNGCGKCVESCPINIIKKSEGIVRIDNTRCIKCKTCVVVCPMSAITLR